MISTQQHVESPVKHKDNVYSAKNLISSLGLARNEVTLKTNIKAERLVMGMEVSPALKLACFELQQVHPEAYHNTLREITL